MNHLLRLFFFVLVAFVSLQSSLMHAQLAVYGGFSAASTSGVSSQWSYGGMVGLYKQSGHLASIINIGGDLRGSFITRNDFHYYTGAVGPRVAFKVPVLPLRPYVEGLVGVASYNAGNASDSTTHFNYQVVGGLDLTLVPHVDWRVVDFDYSAVSGQNVNAKILSTGLVIRLW